MGRLSAGRRRDRVVGDARMNETKLDDRHSCGPSAEKPDPAQSRNGEFRQRPCALRAERLTCRYAAEDVFADVGFELDQGSIAFLTGPNGAGKSTLFRCLAGWSAPREGSIELFGEPFDGSDRTQRAIISYVPDVPSFYDDLTAGEHIRFMLQANGMGVGGSKAQTLMDRFGLSSHLDQYPSSYSRGMRQKLALVIALSLDPRLLLLDEPYGPLDPAAAIVLSEMLVEARDRGAAVLVSCHHDVPALEPDTVLRLADGALMRFDANAGLSEGLSTGLPNLAERQ